MEMAYSVSQQNTFKESKEEIIKIFSEVFNYVNDSDEFLRSIHNSGAMSQALINDDDVILLSKFVERVKGIQSVISRDNMNCAFFGRTSNGKSTTINAMLGDRILPADFGHTTCCFLEIRGTKESQGSYSIVRPVESVEHMNIDSVLEFAQDLSSNRLPTDSLIRIAWPSQECALLSEDVVILDSPGIDLDSDMDQWIDKYCLDADVFVLVVSSLSALSKTEKDFFHKVCKKLSKPNVFILNNYWDIIMQSPNYAQIRKQHMERCVNFLSKELKVCSDTEAESCVFFVSAAEVLSERSKKNKIESGVPNSPDSSGNNWQSRLSEFIDFEEILGKTMSESATKTKFKRHSSEGQEIVREMRCVVEMINKKAQEQKDAAVSSRNEMETRCNTITSSRNEARDNSTKDISSVSAEVSEKVDDKLNNEVQHLDVVIDKFDQEFSDEPKQLKKYKAEMSKYVEKELGNSMKMFYNRDYRKQVQAVFTAMLDRFQNLVQDKDVTDEMRQLVCDDYVPELNIAFEKISSDFQENISWYHWRVTKWTFKCLFTREKWSAEIKKLGLRMLAKEQALKDQYRWHVAKKLQPQKAGTSKPQSALNTTFERLDALAEKHEQKLRVDIAQLHSGIHGLDDIIAKSQNLTNTALDLEKDFKDFHHKYILA